MLSTNVFIDSVTSLGSGQYTFDLYFSQLSLARYLNIGDYVKDTANNEYNIILLSNNPHSDGSNVTVAFVTNDVSPLQDSDYNSSAYTPGQADVRPSGRTAVNINSASIFDSQNYEYTISLTVDSLSEANNIVVSDSIVDINGKEFEITFIDAGSRFNAPIRAKEAHNEGVLPSLGGGSLYQATDSIGLFRGTPILDPSRTVVRNRDNFVVDATFADLQTQIDSVNASTGSVSIANTTGSTIVQGTPIGIDVSGEMQLLDVSIEANILSFVGLVKIDTPNGTSGDVLASGLVEDINTTAALDKILYISKTGGLTDIQPELGVGGFISGDIIIKVGKVSKNTTNGTLKDVVVQPQIIGQL